MTAKSVVGRPPASKPGCKVLPSGYTQLGTIVPESLHQQLRIRAFEHGEHVHELVTRAIARELERETNSTSGGIRPA